MSTYEKTNIAFLALNAMIGLASFVPELFSCVSKSDLLYLFLSL